MLAEVQVPGIDLCHGIVDAAVRVWASVLLWSSVGHPGTALPEYSKVSDF